MAIDFESFADIMPQYFTAIRIRSSRDNVSVVEQHVRWSGRDMSMMTKHIVDYPHTHEVFVIGGDCKGSHITESYEEVQQSTIMTIDADVRLGGIMRIGGWLGGGRIRRSIEEITDEFARLAEQHG